MAEGRPRQIQFEIDVTGASQAGSEISRVNQAFESTSRSAGSAGQSVRATGAVVTEGGRKWGELAGAIGNVGAVAGTLSPRMNALGGVIGAVGSASSALTGALGPLGVAMAAATTAVGLYAAAAQRQREQLEAQQRATQRLARSYTELSGEIQGAIDRMVNLSRIQAGQGSGVETMARSQELSNRLTLMQRAIAGDATAADELRRQGVTGEAVGANRGFIRSAAGAIFGDRRAGVGQLTADEVQAVESAMVQTRRALQQTTEALGVTTERATEAAEAARQVAENRSAGITPRSGGGGAAARRAEEERLARVAEKARLNEVVRQEEAAAEQIQQVRAQLAQWTAETDAMLLEERKANLRELEQAEIAKIESIKQERQQEIEAARQAEIEERERIKNESMPILQSVVSGLTDALAATISGAKSADEAFQGLLASFLEMIAQQTALQAAKEFAEAIAAFAQYRYDQGAQHLAAGAAFTAVAVAAGAASVAVAPPAAAAPASPQAGAANDNGGGSSYTFNINGPVVSAGTRANLGRELSSIIGEGERRFARA